MIMIGTTGCGKTTWLLELLKRVDRQYDPVPNQIIYAYGREPTTDDYLHQMHAMGVTLHKGLPTEEYLDSLTGPFLLILDDLMLMMSKKYLSEIFTYKSHHDNFGVIVMTQDPYDKNLYTARMNARYLVLMRMKNGRSQIKYKGHQMYPGSTLFMEAYDDATKEKYGYLLVDLDPNTPNELNLRTNIFSYPQTVYLPN